MVALWLIRIFSLCPVNVRTCMVVIGFDSSIGSGESGRVETISGSKTKVPVFESYNKQYL